MKLKKILFYLGALIILAMIVLIIYIYPFYRFYFTPRITSIDKGLTLMTGAGNSGILVTDSAVVVIDTKMNPIARKLHDLAIEKAGDKKIIVINTHFHADHIFGNRLFKGCTIYIGDYDKGFVKKNIRQEDMPSIFVHDSLILPLGDETVALYNMGRGHTFDDLVVYLKNRKLLFSGDLIFNSIHPVLIREDGSDIYKWKEDLKQISRMDIKTVIPGHGNPGGPELITTQYNYFADMQMAVSVPSKRKELTARYSGWRNLPLMSSPARTIKFIRGK